MSLRAPAAGEGAESRGDPGVRPSGGRTPAKPGDGEGRSSGKPRRSRRPRPSPSELPPAERAEKAYSAALGLLARRERSRAELRTKLRSKGFDPDTIDAALDRLASSGLQSDARFADLFASTAHRSRGLSASAVQGELLRRGIDRRLAAEASAERPEDEEARAGELASRRAARLDPGLAPDVRRRRIASFLARRGFPSEICWRLAADAVSAGEDTGEDFPIS